MPELALLGGFELAVSGRRVALSRSVERLLALLALEDRPLLRDRSAARLWPDGSDERSRANLRSALWRLRRIGQPLVDTEGGRLRLNESVRVDVDQVLSQSARLIGSQPCSEEDLDPRPLLDDLLPDWYDEWVLLEQERLRQVRMRALEALCLRLTALGRFAAAVESAYGAVRIEPLRESGHKVLIQVHLAEGNRGEAYRSTSACGG